MNFQRSPLGFTGGRSDLSACLLVTAPSPLRVHTARRDLRYKGTCTSISLLHSHPCEGCLLSLDKGVLGALGRDARGVGSENFS